MDEERKQIVHASVAAAVVGGAAGVLFTFIVAAFDTGSFISAASSSRGLITGVVACGLVSGLASG